jgi:hypothetical protein
MCTIMEAMPSFRFPIGGAVLEFLVSPLATGAGGTGASSGLLSHPVVESLQRWCQGRAGDLQLQRGKDSHAVVNNDALGYLVAKKLNSTEQVCAPRRFPPPL